MEGTVWIVLNRQGPCHITLLDRGAPNTEHDRMNLIDRRVRIRRSKDNRCSAGGLNFNRSISDCPVRSRADMPGFAANGTVSPVSGTVGAILCLNRDQAVVPSAAIELMKCQS